MTIAMPELELPLAVVETPMPVLVPRPPRITSIDAARGFVMLTMIFVNDLAGVSDKIVPWWMKHYSDMHPEPKIHDGLTFVDLVFPGFLFLVGMSIPFALGGRLKKGEPWYSILGHVLIRTASLLFLGILMVNGEDGPTSRPHFSRDTWAALMFSFAIIAFCQITPFWLKKRDVEGQKRWSWISIGVRTFGLIGLIVLAFVYTKTGKKHHGVATITHLIQLHPFFLRTSWFGILGLIGWAYLMGSIVYLFFRNNRLSLAVCTALLLGFWVADNNGSFDHFHLPGVFASTGDFVASVISTINDHVSLGEGLGSLASITVAGTLLASILVTSDTVTAWSRIKFTLWFIAAASFAAMLFSKPFLIWKNDATPSWCLFAAASTATIWLIFYLVGDVCRLTWLTKPFAIAGQNVLLAYLMSEGMESVLNLLQKDEWYEHLAGNTLEHAIMRSFGIGVVLLALTAVLNRLGFRLKL